MDENLLLTGLLMLAGLVGCVLPILPGPPLVWLGALLYAWRTDFQTIGWPLLAFWLVLAVIGATADIWMSFLGAKKGGASGWSQLASLVGGLIGLILFSLPGLLIGAIGAIVAVEWRRHQDWSKVLRAGGGYLAGYLLAALVEVFVSLTIIGMFAGALMWKAALIPRV